MQQQQQQQKTYEEIHKKSVRAAKKNNGNNTRIVHTTHKNMNRRLGITVHYVIRKWCREKRKRNLLYTKTVSRLHCTLSLCLSFSCSQYMYSKYTPETEANKSVRLVNNITEYIYIQFGLVVAVADVIVVVVVACHSIHRILFIFLCAKSTYFTLCVRRVYYIFSSSSFSCWLPFSLHRSFSHSLLLALYIPFQFVRIIFSK